MEPLANLKAHKGWHLVRDRMVVLRDQALRKCLDSLRKEEDRQARYHLARYDQLTENLNIPHVLEVESNSEQTGVEGEE